MSVPSPLPLADGDPVTDIRPDPSLGFSPDQLAGFRIGVTSDRRSEDLIAAFERRGAEVLHAPAIRIAPADDDAQITTDTLAIIAAEPDVLLATTSYGIRRWFEAADAAGVGQELERTLARSRILVRGPKARGAVRAAGLNDSGMSDEETTASLVDHVLREAATGKKVAVQLHGFTDHAQLDRLTAAGAEVLTVAPYRWLLPEDSTRVIRLVDAICTGSLDAVTFTSAPAVEALLSAADGVGRLEQVLDALAETVVPAAVGHVTAAPLVNIGLSPIVPDRYRMGALIRLVCEYLTEQRVERVETALGMLELRGSALTLGDSTTTLAVTPLTMMRRFIAARGAVVSRSELSAAIADAPDDHAVDVAISRLRHVLPDPELITTVIKRGYRLNV